MAMETVTSFLQTQTAQASSALKARPMPMSSTVSSSAVSAASAAASALQGVVKPTAIRHPPGSTAVSSKVGIQAQTKRTRFASKESSSSKALTSEEDQLINGLNKSPRRSRSPGPKRRVTLMATNNGYGGSSTITVGGSKVGSAAVAAKKSSMTHQNMGNKNNNASSISNSKANGLTQEEAEEILTLALMGNYRPDERDPLAVVSSLPVYPKGGARFLLPVAALRDNGHRLSAFDATLAGGGGGLGGDGYQWKEVLNQPDILTKRGNTLHYKLYLCCVGGTDRTTTAFRRETFEIGDWIIVSYAGSELEAGPVDPLKVRLLQQNQLIAQSGGAQPLIDIGANVMAPLPATSDHLNAEGIAAAAGSYLGARASEAAAAAQAAAAFFHEADPQTGHHLTNPLLATRLLGTGGVAGGVAGVGTGGRSSASGSRSPKPTFSSLHPQPPSSPAQRLLAHAASGGANADQLRSLQLSAAALQQQHHHQQQQQLPLRSSMIHNSSLSLANAASTSNIPGVGATHGGQADAAALQPRASHYSSASLPRPSTSASVSAARWSPIPQYQPHLLKWYQDLVLISEELAAGKVVKNLTIFPSLQLTLLHPDMTKEFENCCRILSMENGTNLANGGNNMLETDMDDVHQLNSRSRRQGRSSSKTRDRSFDSSNGIKLFYDTTFCFGDIYATVLTFVNGCYEGNPVMPLAVNLHERKFKSSHQLFWARIVGDLPALQKYRFPLIIDDAEPAVHLAVRTQAPNLVQLEAWTHRFKDIDTYLRGRGYGEEAVHYYKACISYLLHSESKQNMHDRFRKEFESVWPKDFVFYYRQRLLPRSGRLGQWAMAKMRIKDDNFLSPYTNPQMAFHAICQNFKGWESLTLDQIVRAFYFLFLFFISESCDASYSDGIFQLKVRYKNEYEMRAASTMTRAARQSIPHPSKIREFIKKKYPSGCATSGGGGQRAGSAAGFHPTGGGGGGSGSGPGSASSMSPRFAAATFSSAAEAQYYTTTAAGGAAAAAAAAAEAAATGGGTVGGSRMLHHATALFNDGDDEDEDIDLQMQQLDQTVRNAAAATGSLRRASGKATMEELCDNLDAGGGVSVGLGIGGGGTTLHVGPSSSSNHRRRQNLRRRPRTLSRQMAELNLDQSEEDELLRVTREDPFLSVAAAARDRFVPSPAPNGGGLSPATMLARPSPHHPPPLPPELAAVVSSVAAIPAISSAASAASSSYHASSAINNATGGIMLANLGAGTLSSQSNTGSLMTTFAEVEASLAASGSAAASSVAAPVTSAGNPSVPSQAGAASAAPKQINFTSLTTIPENPSESRNTSMVSQDSWQNFSQLSSLGPRDRIGDARANANYCSNQSLDMVDAIHDHEVAAVMRSEDAASSSAGATARTSTTSNMTSAAGFHTTAGIGGGGGGGGGILGSNSNRGVNSRAIMQQQQQQQRSQQLQHKPQQRPQQLDTSGKATHPAVTSSGVVNKGATPKQSQSASAAAGAGSMMLWKKVQQTVVFGGSFITQQGKGGHVDQHPHHQQPH